MMQPIKLEEALKDKTKLAEISQFLNEKLGDKSGRTICLRMAHGLKNSFYLDFLSSKEAVDVVHASMATSTALLFSKYKGVKLAGLLMALGLFVSYYQGTKAEKEAAAKKENLDTE